MTTLTGAVRDRQRGSEREAGAAMLIAVMAITVVAVLSATIAVLAVRSTRASGDARTASVAKDLANAGLAAGVTYLRQTGATPAINDASNTYADPARGCESHTVNTAAPAWTRANAARVDAGQQGQYEVWIEKIVAPVGTTAGAYRVCSYGISGVGMRTVSVVAHYTPAGGNQGPYVVYSDSSINLQSSAQVITNMSVYSKDCIQRKRNQETIAGTDPQGRPAAAHSMTYVTALGTCTAAGSVHEAGSDPVDGDGHGDPDGPYPYDTDKAGGPVVGDADYNATTRPTLDGAPWSGSTGEASATTDAFHTRWGIPDMLGATSITALELEARSQNLTVRPSGGNYYSLPSNNTSSVNTPTEANAVIFLNFQSHVTLDLNTLNFIPSWARTAPQTTAAGCSAVNGKSLILVVRNADVTGNSNDVLRANILIKQGGVLRANGNIKIIGGVLADNAMDLSGNATLQLDPCALNNPPPGGTPQVDVTDYSEYDR